ncbi:MAG: MaoC family dehydratase N-terminal domain-containing protein [Anaerolineae bacterium]|nr:MaoC family dehydratase N-terminal domain-containing protein [Anaerolineae bacterium]
MPYTPRGKYFEELELGQEIFTASRTITESDLVQFANLTGDTNPMHTDAESSKSGMFGERIAHGLLGLSYTMGLLWPLGFMEGTVMAFMGLEAKFKAPIKIGDTIHAMAKIKQKKEMKAMGGGIVVLESRLYNQRQEVTQQADMTVLIKSKPHDPTV